jgi:hypothetical protein
MIPLAGVTLEFVDISNRVSVSANLRNSSLTLGGSMID